MSIECDPVTTLQHYPLPMRKYGLNPFGEPLYRIVLTQSVMHLVGGQWPDGSRSYRWVPRYRQVRAGWILEAWSLPKISRREWEELTDPISGWPVLGPYPSRGEYSLSWEFDQGVSADCIDSLIGAIERGRDRSFQTVRDFAMKEYQQEERATRDAATDEVRDCITAFGVSAISSLTGVSRGTKTNPDLRTAEDLGLPIPRTGPAVNRTIGSRRTFDMRDAKLTSTFISGA